MIHRVFVYGTLKRGQPNHHIITESKEGKYTFIGQGHTVAKYSLVIASVYNVPFLLDTEGEGCNVIGEVYEVDDILFGEFDALEGYPGFYDRRKFPIQIEKSADGTDCQLTEECWVYFLPNFKPEMRELEKFENYDSYGSHGKVYVRSEELDEKNDI